MSVSEEIRAQVVDFLRHTAKRLIFPNRALSFAIDQIGQVAGWGVSRNWVISQLAFVSKVFRERES